MYLLWSLVILNKLGQFFFCVKKVLFANSAYIILNYISTVPSKGKLPISSFITFIKLSEIFATVSGWLYVDEVTSIRL